MATTREQIQEWLDRAEPEHTHMIVVCDTFDWEDYPVYISKEQDVKKIEKQYNKNMQKVMEVYSLTGEHDIKTQLAKNKVFNYD
jgi:hypothetical protein